MDDRIIEKIQKLLSLANSDNENEAKMATQKANELLVKYNLNLQQVTDHQVEYVSQDMIETGLTLKPYQKMISSLLIEFFFVRVLISKKHIGYSSGQYSNYKGPRSQYKKVIQLLGTEENCKIAGYIFSYLNDAYPKLWKDYYERDAYLDQSHKISYYTGLTHGIRKMLEDTKWKVQNETGLVLKDDPKLEEFLKSKSSGTYGSKTQSDLDPDVVRDGIRDGAKITLRKPIESKTSQNGTKYLDSKK